jgi:hypothetical protein
MRVDEAKKNFSLLWQTILMIGQTSTNQETRDVINYYSSEKKQSMTVCDVNTHHIWSSGTSSRKGKLMENLASSNLNMLNHGNQLLLLHSENMFISINSRKPK